MRALLPLLLAARLGATLPGAPASAAQRTALHILVPWLLSSAPPGAPVPRGRAGGERCTQSSAAMPRGPGLTAQRDGPLGWPCSEQAGGRCPPGSLAALVFCNSGNGREEGGARLGMRLSLHPLGQAVLGAEGACRSGAVVGIPARHGEICLWAAWKWPCP